MDVLWQNIVLQNIESMEINNNFKCQINTIKLLSLKLDLLITIADISRLKLERHANKLEDYLNIQIMLKVIELTQCENDF
jgi:hypothetical protein